MKNDHWWKMTFDRRRYKMKDNLWWKTTFDGRQPLMEDILWWKTLLSSFNIKVFWFVLYEKSKLASMRPKNCSHEAPKWPMVSGKGSTSRFLGVPVIFIKISFFYPITPSMRKVDDWWENRGEAGRKKRTERVATNIIVGRPPEQQLTAAPNPGAKIKSSKTN